MSSDSIVRTISPATTDEPRYTSVSVLLEWPISSHTSAPSEVDAAGVKARALVREFADKHLPYFAALSARGRPELVHRVTVNSAKRPHLELGPKYGRLHVHFSIDIEHTVYDLPAQPGTISDPAAAWRLPLSGLQYPDILVALKTRLAKCDNYEENLIVKIMENKTSAGLNYNAKGGQFDDFARKLRAGELHWVAKGKRPKQRSNDGG